MNHYSNTVPQKSALNGGRWAQVEAIALGVVRTYGRVWTMTGPLYERPMDPLADEEHRVRSGFWKIWSHTMTTP